MLKMAQRFRPRPRRVSESIPERKRSGAAVEVLQQERGQRRVARAQCQPCTKLAARNVEPVIIPRHFVAEALVEINRNGTVRLHIIEIQCAARLELVESNLLQRKRRCKLPLIEIRRAAANETSVKPERSCQSFGHLPHEAAVCEVVGASIC